MIDWFKKFSRRNPGHYWTRFSIASSRNFRRVVIVWLLLLAGGGLVYSQLIAREGFPQQAFPVGQIQVIYPVDDPQLVDDRLSEPISRILMARPEVEKIQSQASANYFSAFVTFVDGTDPERGPALIDQALAEAGYQAPAGVEVAGTTIQTASFLGQYDLLVAVYDPDRQADVYQLQAQARILADQLAAVEDLTVAEMVPLAFAGCPGCADDQLEQIRFNQVGLKQVDGSVGFYDSVFVGVNRDLDRLDTIGLTDRVNQALAGIELTDQTGRSYDALVAADLAANTRSQIGSLLSNLLTGLVIITFVSFLLISWRAALLTAVFMVSVLALSVGCLYLLGLTLNAIVLFSLLLVLGLFVDDATIIVDALDSQGRSRPWLDQVSLALKRVVSASWVGSLTTILGFLPLLFVSGLIGQVVIYLPITVITSLLVSFILSISLIPALASLLQAGRWRYLDIFDRINPFRGSLAKLGVASSYWLRQMVVDPARRQISQRYLLGALVFGLLVIGAGGYLATRLNFDIFPANRDSGQINYRIEFPGGYDLDQARTATDQIQDLILETVDPEVLLAAHYGLRESLPNNRAAYGTLILTEHSQRSVRAPSIVADLEASLAAQKPDPDLRIRVYQVDPGPRTDEFPLTILVANDDSALAARAAAVIAADLKEADLNTSNGQPIAVAEIRPGPADLIQRYDGRMVASTAVKFDNPNLSAVISVASDYLKTEFDQDRLQQLGLPAGSLILDLGQEADSQESFKSAQYIFVVALVLIYTLVAFEFRSLIKPFLVLTALPFALPGAVLFLYLTEIPVGFFSALGLIGLAGIVVNNTILVLTAANQQRQAGLSPSASIAQALQDRFRPLITTTLTTVVALLPLMVGEPVWEPLVGVMLAGLLSSTVLVILMFPSLYLAGGYLWRRWRSIRRRYLSRWGFG